MDQYCRMASRCSRDMLANAGVGGQLGMSILGPPTAAVPAPVFSMKNSLQMETKPSSRYRAGLGRRHFMGRLLAVAVPKSYQGEAILQKSDETALAWLAVFISRQVLS